MTRPSLTVSSTHLLRRTSLYPECAFVWEKGPLDPYVSPVRSWVFSLHPFFRPPLRRFGSSPRPVNRIFTQRTHLSSDPRPSSHGFCTWSLDPPSPHSRGRDDGGSTLCAEWTGGEGQESSSPPPPLFLSPIRDSDKWSLRPR